MRDLCSANGLAESGKAGLIDPAASATQGYRGGRWRPRCAGEVLRGYFGCIHRSIRSLLPPPIIWAEYRIIDDRVQPSCQTSADLSPRRLQGGHASTWKTSGRVWRECCSGCVSVIGRRGDSRSGLGLSGWPNQRRHCASRPRTGRPRLPTTTLSADGNEQSSELEGAGFCACQMIPCPRAWRPEASRPFP